MDIEMLKKMLGKERYELYSNLPQKNMYNIPREALKKNIEISMSKLEEAFSEEKIDLIMFTDGGIDNLDKVVNFFTERKELNRATIVLVHRFEQSIESKDNVNVHVVENEKDIPDLAIREIQRSIDMSVSDEL